MEDVTSLEGSVRSLDSELVLLIPLEAGGDQLIECSKGVSQVQGEYLKIVIPEWLAGMLRIEKGDLVVVNNMDGKFHIQPVSPRPVH